MGCSGSAEQAKQAKNKNEMKGNMTSQFSVYSNLWLFKF